MTDQHPVDEQIREAVGDPAVPPGGKQRAREQLQAEIQRAVESGSGTGRRWSRRAVAASVAAAVVVVALMMAVINPSPVIATDLEQLADQTRAAPTPSPEPGEVYHWESVTIHYRDVDGRDLGLDGGPYRVEVTSHSRMWADPHQPLIVRQMSSSVRFDDPQAEAAYPGSRLEADLRDQDQTMIFREHQLGTFLWPEDPDELKQALIHRFDLHRDFSEYRLVAFLLEEFGRRPLTSQQRAAGVQLLGDLAIADHVTTNPDGTVSVTVDHPGGTVRRVVTFDSDGHLIETRRFLLADDQATLVSINRLEPPQIVPADRMP